MARLRLYDCADFSDTFTLELFGMLVHLPIRIFALPLLVEIAEPNRYAMNEVLMEKCIDLATVL